ncbi:FCD domain-containing protein [Phytopseudomonas flavescens]|nr:FCD domain-containing protein [Pseudomonas flavescens]
MFGVEGSLRAFEYRRDHGPMLAPRQMPVARQHDIHRASAQAAMAMSTPRLIAIAEAGKNPYFISYYEKLLGEGQRLLHLHFDYIISTASTTTRLGRDHDVIIDAIAAGNADAAEQAAHEHTMLFQRRFLAYMQQNLTNAVSVKSPLDAARGESDRGQSNERQK